jgi:hypothetical protein
MRLKDPVGRDRGMVQAWTPNELQGDEQGEQSRSPDAKDLTPCHCRPR